MRQVLEASFAYTAIVFGAGFLLGVLRVLLVVPHLGVRYAELLELPLMLFVCFLAARFVISRWAPLSRGQCAAVGAVSLLLLVGAELGLVLGQGLSPDVYVAGRDPVSGSAYLLSLLAFSALPVLVRRAPGDNAR